MLTAKVNALRAADPHSRKVFVVGCGRSGTHWLGRALEAHPSVRATIESPAIFWRVVQMAVDPSTRPRHLRRLLWRYRFEHARSAPRFYLDKSHPNLWLFDELRAAFPDARFVGIQRGPYATVSSMLEHPGVRAWCENWERYPIPNAFLGVTEENLERYRGYSIAARCAQRWRCHAERMGALAAAHPDLVHVVCYEALMDDTIRQLDALQAFLGLEGAIPAPQVQRASRSKWHRGLTARQIEEVADVTGVPPPVGSESRRVDSDEPPETARPAAIDEGGLPASRRTESDQ
jgi:hypothetical protein